MKEIYVLTGATRGIGKETAVQLLRKRKNAVLILGCRKKTSVETWSGGDKELNERKIYFEHLDLQSFVSVRKFVNCVVKRVGHFKVRGLVNCAHESGLRDAQRTVDDVEVSYQTNHLSHFLLTLLLVPHMDNECGSRIVHVTSRTYRLGVLNRNAYNSQDRNLKKSTYDGSRVYPDTKLMQILFSKMLQAQLEALGYNNILTQCVHPGGMVRTAPSNTWFRSSDYVFVHRIEPLVMYLFGSSLSKAGEAVMRTLLYSKSPGGRYWHEQKEEEILPRTMKAQDCDWLWKTSCEIVKIPHHYLYLQLGKDPEKRLLQKCASHLAALVRTKYDNIGLWSDVYIHATYDDMGLRPTIYDAYDEIKHRVLRCDGATFDLFQGSKPNSPKDSLRLRVLSAMISSAASHFLYASNRKYKQNDSLYEFRFRISRTKVPDRNGDSEMELEINNRGGVFVKKADVSRLLETGSIRNELEYNIRRIREFKKNKTRCCRCC